MWKILDILGIKVIMRILEGRNWPTIILFLVIAILFVVGLAVWLGLRIGGM